MPKKENIEFVPETKKIKSLSIDFNQINNVIGILERAIRNDAVETVFDPVENVYIFDGQYKVTAHFFADTCSKFSHYINTVSRAIIKANDNYQENAFTKKN